MIVDCACAGVVLIAPHLVQKVIVRNYMVGIRHEKFEDLNSIAVKFTGRALRVDVLSVCRILEAPCELVESACAGTLLGRVTHAHCGSGLGLASSR